MYQVEVKRYLIEHLFRPSDGWNVSVDLDAMEMGKGGQHPDYGRVDIVAEHGEHGIYLIEAEGDTSRQKEQSMYSALGQTIIMMKD